MSLLRLITFRQQSEPAEPPALWTPAEISTGLWLDSADTSTITLNGSTVSQWNDKSGNNRNVSQATPGSQPVYSATGLNGKPSVYFDGSDDWLQVNSSPVSNYPCFFSIVLQANNPSPGFALSIIEISTTGNYFVLNQSTFGGTPKTVYQPRVNSAFQLEAASTLGTEIIEGFSLASNDHYLYRNGSLIASGTTNIPYMNPNTVLVGRLRTAASALFWPGHIQEIVICNSSLSADNREKLEGYLAHKWGLTASLPGGHPYKTIPPYV